MKSVKKLEWKPLMIINKNSKYFLPPREAGEPKSVLKQTVFTYLNFPSHLPTQHCFLRHLYLSLGNISPVTHRYPFAYLQRLCPNLPVLLGGTIKRWFETWIWKTTWKQETQKHIPNLWERRAMCYTDTCVLDILPAPFNHLCLYFYLVLLSLFTYPFLLLPLSATLFPSL